MLPVQTLHVPTVAASVTNTDKHEVFIHPTRSVLCLITLLSLLLSLNTTSCKPSWRGDKTPLPLLHVNHSILSVQGLRPFLYILTALGSRKVMVEIGTAAATLTNAPCIFCCGSCRERGWLGCPYCAQ